jgi:hypothetical protein
MPCKQGKDQGDEEHTNHQQDRCQDVLTVLFPDIYCCVDPDGDPAIMLAVIHYRVMYQDLVIAIDNGRCLTRAYIFRKFRDMRFIKVIAKHYPVIGIAQYDIANTPETAQLVDKFDRILR